MAIGPNNTFINYARIDEAEQLIDKKLSNTSPLNLEFGDKDNHGIWVIIPCPPLTIPEKKELEDRYNKAGWKNVRVRNSTDHGERAGLVTLIIPSKDNDVGFPARL